MKFNCCIESARILALAVTALIAASGCAAPTADDATHVSEANITGGEVYTVDAVAVRRLVDKRQPPPAVLADPRYWRGELAWSPTPLGEPLETVLGPARVTINVRGFVFDPRASAYDTFRADVRVSHPRLDGQPGDETTSHADVLFTRQSSGGYNAPGYWAPVPGDALAAKLTFASDRRGRRVDGTPSSGPEALESLEVSRFLGSLPVGADAWLELRPTTAFPVQSP